ncbi:MAG: AMP-binding protein, partial [Rhodocyclaceae bacterium]
MNDRLSRIFPTSLVGHLCALAAERPSDVALMVVGERNGVAVDTPVSYAELDRRVRALAAQLQQRFDMGERALLLLDNDDHYVVAFLACLYAGLIAVPVFPPESARPQHLARLAGIAQDAQARCVLTVGVILDMLGTAIDGFSGCEAIAVDGIDFHCADDWRPHWPSADELAFLQYTSGSTSAPKGVMVSHGSLMANERAIEETISIRPDDVFVSWLPLYHDMGLIGGLLQPLHRGVPVALMTPRFFLERPIRWLEAITRHRASVSGGPDFAYRLCLERVKDTQVAQLDLSSWRVAFSGAEPVRHDTLRAFVDRFAPAGFACEAVYPCYGLAEATLLVTGGIRGQGMVTRAFSPAAMAQGRAQADADGSILVGCGRAPATHQVEIVDPTTLMSLAEGEVGEIWANGPSIAQGYWRRPEESALSFVERDGRRWLRTGDLGFVHQGELFITGRLKDLIILRGQNVYPQDIERAIEAEVEAVRKGRVAAFAVPLPEGGEGVGVAVEVSRGLQKLVPVETLVEALSQATVTVCNEPVAVAVLLNPGALPKTSSGKLQRGACRQGWCEHSLDAYGIYEYGRFVLGGQMRPNGVASTQPELDALEAALAEVWRAVLKHDNLPAREAHFFVGGGNSLAAVELAARISERWEVDFPVRSVFEQPRFADLAGQLRTFLGQGTRKPKVVIPVLPPERRTEPLPLSAAQRRQWFLWQLDPQSTAYHVQGALRIAGALDAEAMCEAVAELARRHESLRTVFRARTDGDVEQIVQPDGSLDLQFIDLREAATDDREVRAVEALRTLNAQPFDLTRGPLARAALVRLGEQTHVLALAMHHIISDGASMQVIVDELAALYTARLGGERGGALPLPAIQYADYAAWQHAHPDKEAHERQLAYWRKQLEVAPGEAQPVLALPTDHPRQPVARYRAAQHRFELPADLLVGLRRQAETHGATLFMVLLSAFQALLYRYTGQRDIRVGVPVANRPQTELQGVVGFFVNTLVLRNVLDGRMSLEQVLSRARDAALEGQAHQGLPFEQLVEALQPERSLSHSPLFQVMFNHLQEDYGFFARQTGLAVAEQALPEQAAQYELTMGCSESRDGRVRVMFSYAKELFEPETIERMVGHYVAVLQALAERPQVAVGEIELMSVGEHQQLARWGVNAQRYPEVKPVHRLIERRVQGHPDAVALIFGDETLSYSELNTRANRLAHRLIELGVKQEVKVGLAVERSVEMVVGLLAVLKAGGAYVPLDPSLPVERLAYMVDDSGLGLLLTQSQVRDRLPVREGLRVLELDALALGGEPARDPTVAVHGESLAYVIYTSGSTGRPKGVAVAHGPFGMHCVETAALYELGPRSRELHFLSFSFDGAHERLFTVLSCGAS